MNNARTTSHKARRFWLMSCQNPAMACSWFAGDLAELLRVDPGRSVD